MMAVERMLAIVAELYSVLGFVTMSRVARMQHIRAEWYA